MVMGRIELIKDEDPERFVQKLAELSHQKSNEKVTKLVLHHSPGGSKKSELKDLPKFLVSPAFSSLSMVELDLRIKVSTFRKLLKALEECSIPEIAFRGHHSLLGTLLSSKHLARLKSLRLSGLTMTPEHIETLAANAGLANLKELDLSNSNVTEEGAEIIAGSKTLSGLQRLNMSCNTIGHSGTLALCRSTALSSLEKLDLSENHISGHTFVELGALENLGPPLKEFTLSTTMKVRPAEEAELVDATWFDSVEVKTKLSPWLEPLSILRKPPDVGPDNSGTPKTLHLKLDDESPPVSEDIAKVFALRHASRLVLSWYRQNPEPKHFSQLIGSPYLRGLTSALFSFDRDRYIEWIIGSLAHSKSLSSLRWLELDHSSGISAVTAKALADSSTLTLEGLKITSSFGLTSETFEEIAKISTLKAFGCSPHEKQLKEIANLTGELRLTRLDVSHYPTASQRTGTPKSFFADQRLTTVEHLSMRARALNLSDLEELSKARHLSSLKSLDLSSNSFALADLLPIEHAFPALEHLYLSKVRDTRLLRVFDDWPLRSLGLSSCSLTDNDVETFCSFEGLEGLTYLDLSDNRLTDKSIESLSSCSSLRSLRLLDLSENKELSFASVNKLLSESHFDHLEALYLHSMPNISGVQSDQLAAQAASIGCQLVDEYDTNLLYERSCRRAVHRLFHDDPCLAARYASEPF